MTEPEKSGVNWFILGGGLGGLLLLCAVLWFAFGRDPRAVPSMFVGKPGPVFALTDLDGKTWDLNALRGHKVVVNFWSTWCLPCRQEYPLLQQAPPLWPDAQFLGVIYQDTPEKIAGHLARSPIPAGYPNLVDPKGHVALDYGVAGVPETFFLDEQGKIVYKHVGPLDRATLVQWLGPPKASP